MTAPAQKSQNPINFSEEARQKSHFQTNHKPSSSFQVGNRQSDAVDSDGNIIRISVEYPEEEKGEIYQKNTRRRVHSDAHKKLNLHFPPRPPELEPNNTSSQSNKKPENFLFQQENQGSKEELISNLSQNASMESNRKKKKIKWSSDSKGNQEHNKGSLSIDFEDENGLNHGKSSNNEKNSHDPNRSEQHDQDRSGHYEHNRSGLHDHETSGQSGHMSGNFLFLPKRGFEPSTYETKKDESGTPHRLELPHLGFEDNEPMFVLQLEDEGIRKTSQIDPDARLAPIKELSKEHLVEENQASSHGQERKRLKEVREDEENAEKLEDVNENDFFNFKSFV